MLFFTLYLNESTGFTGPVLDRCSKQEVKHTLLKDKGSEYSANELFSNE